MRFLNFKQMIKVFFALFACLFLINVKAYAFTGWTMHNGRHCYLNSDGRMVTNAWRESNGNMFFLGADGYMVQNSYFQYGDEFYYVDAEGHRVTNDFVYIDSAKAPNHEDWWGIHYFDERGMTVRRISGMCKKVIDSRAYTFDELGVAAEGWFTEDGDLITDPTNILTDGVYCSNGDGLLMRNTWYNFTDDLGAYAYGETESSVIGDKYDYLPVLWMYFDNNCKKTKGTYGNSKNKKINGNQYAFDDYGIAVLGFTKNNAGIDTTQKSNPTLLQNVKMYHSEEGKLMKSHWLFTKPSLDMNEDDYNDDVKSWFYSLSSGVAIKNKVQSISGKKYVFDGVGRMRKGIVLTDGAGYFVASYKPEELKKDDFIYGGTAKSKFYGTALSDVRYCGPDDDNDGVMRYGEQKIELDDYVGTFLFNSNGIAYGNRNILKRKSDRYYINGLLLQPFDAGVKYGVVKVSDTEYRVVDQNGKIVKAKKKVLKDQYDNDLIIKGDLLIAYLESSNDKVKVKWINKSKKLEDKGFTESGFYYDSSDVDSKGKRLGPIGLAVPSGQTYPTASQIKKMPDEIRLNFAN